MAGIFTFIGLLGVLVGAAAAAAGLYQTFGETQGALDAWVAGAQVFFLGAMLMALGSVAARVKGTSRAIEELAKAVRAMREPNEAAAARAPRAPLRDEDEPAIAPAPRHAGAARSTPAPADPEPALGRERAARLRQAEAEPRIERDHLPERRPERGPDLRDRDLRDRDEPVRPQAARRTRLGPALGEERDPPGESGRRGSRVRRPFDDE